MERAQLASRLGEPAVRAKLRRAVCRFPSEWDQSTVVARYSWLLTEDFKPADDDATGAQKWERFVKHARAISFTNLPKDFLKADWRFHPREFVTVMRTCGWLSKKEFARVYPNTYQRRIGTRTEVARNALSETIQDRYRVFINIATRKYLIFQHAERTAQFFGQGAEESRTLTSMNEIRSETSCNQLYGGRMGNDALGDGYLYRGRGMKQLTGKYNYSEYWVYRGWLDRSSFTASWWSHRQNTRPPQISNPDRLISDHYSTVDAGGWYWIASPHRGGPHLLSSINRLIPLGAAPTLSSVELITRGINGGSTGLENRMFHTTRIYEILGDNV